MYMRDKVQLFDTNGQTLHDIHGQVSEYADYYIGDWGFDSNGSDLASNVLTTMGYAHKIIYELFYIAV